VLALFPGLVPEGVDVQTARVEPLVEPVDHMRQRLRSIKMDEAVKA